MKYVAENKEILNTDVVVHTESKRLTRLEHYQRLGLKIAYYRKLKGMSQIKLSELANISRTYLSNIEAPKSITNPTLDVIFDIANALDVPVSKLFDETI